MKHRQPPSRRQDGQILVIFGLSLMTLLGLAGLTLDAGATFAQRRTQQTAADLAALAAANDYLINNDDALAIARAKQVSGENGFSDGVGGSVVGVAIDTSNGVEITVGVDGVHQNSFLGILGMSTWPVSTQAVALAGFPDMAYGAAPFIFAISAFEDDGTPKYQTMTDFGMGNGDVPNGPLDFSWSNFGTGNVNTTEVDQIIQGNLVIDRQISYGQYIGQHNNGNHTYLYDSVDNHLSGLDMPVAVVDVNGNFMGWATFHVDSADKNNKHIRGHFVSSFESARLTVSNCASGACPRYLGSYVLKLVD